MCLIGWVVTCVGYFVVRRGVGFVVMVVVSRYIGLFCWWVDGWWLGGFDFACLVWWAWCVCCIGLGLWVYYN